MAVFICADLALDAACDPIELPGAVSAGAELGPVNGSSAGFRSFCVPDCFCCSRSETAELALPLPPLDITAKAPAPIPVSVTTVVRPVLELPPVALSLS